MKFPKPNILNILLAIVILLPYIGFGGFYLWNQKKMSKIDNANIVVISKQNMSLSVYDYKGHELCKFPIACGKNFGNKENEGDLKTPEGVFKVSSIENAENWKHDFKDGNGDIEGAYGPIFIRLYTPGHTGIGIHGTHDNSSIGDRITEGCIRIENKNVIELAKMIHHGTVVIITPSADDVIVKETTR